MYFLVLENRDYEEDDLEEGLRFEHLNCFESFVV